MSEDIHKVSMEQDNIMQLVELFKNDTRTDKINLAIGIYVDESGDCPILTSVKEAEKYCCDIEKSKAKFNLIGDNNYHKVVKELLFPDFSKREKEDIQVIQTVGSSGALYIAGQLINKIAPNSKIWISNPTWENHKFLLYDDLSKVCEYRYEPFNKQRLCIEKIIEDLNSARKGDFILFHVCCHNPTGMDPSMEQWKQLSRFCKEKGLIPIFDFAYQGFKENLKKDANVFNIFKKDKNNFIVCNSFSKNMGLYDERIGALTFVFDDKTQSHHWIEIAKKIIRSTYSVPPIHGSSIVNCIINDTQRFKVWERELSIMRREVENRRTEFFKALEEMGIKQNILSYENQSGMFVCLNLSLAQIENLRKNYGIYILNSGRISIASLNAKKISRLCNALCNI